MNYNYSNKLKHPKWQKKRLEIFNRDGFKCCLCDDAEDTLHVHHKSYGWNKEPWEYDNDNFQTLCEICHKAIEKLKEAEFVTPIKAFKTSHDNLKLTYLNVITKDKTADIKTVQIFRDWNGEFIHLLAMRKETMEEIIQIIDEDETPAGN